MPVEQLLGEIADRILLRGSSARSAGRAGYTLIELLVVALVLAILFGVTLVTLAGARVRAYQSGHIGALRQLGLGAAMYIEGSDSFDWSALRLVRAGLVPSALLASPLDPLPEGAANTHRVNSPPEPEAPTSFKDSVFTARDFLGPNYWEAIGREPSAGWALIQATGPTSRRSEVGSWYFSGLYSNYFHLLRVDTAVVYRSVRYVSSETSRSVRSQDLFFDEDPVLR